MTRKALKHESRAKIAPGKKPKYHRLTRDNRIQIRCYLQAGLSLRKIALELNVSASTISREIKRNSGGKGYRPSQANEMARARIAIKSEKRRKLTEEIWSLALGKLSLGWSFEAFCGRGRLEGKNYPCRETLYLKYYREQGHSDLPTLPKGHRKRHKRGRKCQAGRGCIPNRRGIELRSKLVERRKAFGHFEGDLINGLHGTGNIATIVERATRFTLFGYVPDKRADHVAPTLTELMSAIPETLRETLTLDNGKEFAAFSKIEDALGLTVYFANPYHSWERGTNENRNGIVRKVLPKKSSFENITEEQTARIDQLLNDRPMKCLGWRTPREMFKKAIEAIGDSS